MHNMERRPLDIERDYEYILPMQRQSWQINFPGELTSEKGFRRFLTKAVRRGEVYVYEIDGTIVAWLWLDLSASKLTGHIRHVQVEQSYWGKGLGRCVVEDAISLSIEAGRRALTLNVTKSNRRAMALYERLGFIVEANNGERQFMKLEL